MFFSLFGLTPPSPSHEWEYGESNVAFHIGSLTIDWYGVFVSIGFILAIVLALIKLKFWYKIKTDPFYYYCLMGIPLAIIGARFWSCCINDASWSTFWRIWEGGLAIQGGVVLDVLLALWWFPFILKNPKYHVRDILLSPEQPAVRQVSMWLYADAILPCILIGQVIGRWGNYFNQELYGAIITPTDGNMWYLNFLSKVLPYMYIADSGKFGYLNYTQPLFLYESMLNFLGLILIYVVMEFIPKIKAGTIGITYMAWYSTIRLSLEGLRAPTYRFDPTDPTGLNGATYIMCSIWLGLSVILIVLNQCNVIPKTRKYRCKFLLWESFIYFWSSLFNNISISTKERKRKNLSEKIKEPWVDVQKINIILNKTEGRLNYAYQKRSNIKARYEKVKNSYARANINYLYYLGK